MKNLLFAFTVLLTVASCNTTKKFTTSFNDFLKKHNYQEQAVYDKATKSTTFTASIENLYDTTKLKEICSQADVTFKIVGAKIIITGNCPGAEQKVQEIIKQLTKAIVFKQ